MIMHIDEHMLAGFMAGELSEQDRASVTAALIRDRGLREWLSMASDALATAKTKEGLLNRFLPSMNASRTDVHREDRNALPSKTRVRRAG